MKTGSPASAGAALLAPKQPHPAIALFDTAVVMAVTLVMARSLSPHDPLLLRQQFPWLWLPPAFLALRYGNLGAVAASAFVFGACLAFGGARRGITDIPQQFLLGGLVLTLGIAQFSEVWRGRLRRVRAVNHYLDQRLDALTRRHYLLKQDYQRMEQGLLEKPMTLRHALQGLRRLELPAQTSHGMLPNGQGLLNLLSQICQLEMASLYVDSKGRLQARPVASLGNGSALHADDPMVTLALQRNELCHIQTDALHQAHSRYLVAAPLVTSSGERLGLLLVERLPFLCLREETLRMLSVVLGYYADLISVAPEVIDIRQRLPDCPLAFAQELVRLHHIYRECRIPSTLVALDFNTHQREGNERFRESLRQRRQVDLVWAPATDPERKLLITLMPLHGPLAANGYVRRLTRLFARESGPEGVTAVSLPVDQRAPSDLLAGLLEQCHVMAH